MDDIPIEKITDEVRRAVEGLKDLVSLSMNNCKLATLANFPNCENLVRLELIENKFPASDIKFLVGLKQLQSLSLGNNSINDINDVKPLAALSDLVQLDLSGTVLAQ